MLNEDLIDKKSIVAAKLKIASLEKCIRDFKKYDSERKQYYAKSMMELGQLREYVAELEESPNVVQVERLSKEIKRFNSYFDPQLPVDTEGLSIEEAVNIIQKLKERNAELNKELKSCKKDKENLICELIKIKGTKK